MKTKLLLLLLISGSSVFSQTYITLPYHRDGVYDFQSKYKRFGNTLKYTRNPNFEWKIVYETNSIICSISRTREIISVLYFDLVSMEWSAHTMNHDTLMGGKLNGKKVVPSFGKLQIINDKSSVHSKSSEIPKDPDIDDGNEQGSKSSWRLIKKGMTKNQIKKLLGEPDRIDNFVTLETWSYGYSGNVTFDDEGVIGWNEPFRF